jgi:isocitrate dehydrogenase
MNDDLESSAALLRSLFASLDELCDCQGNKAKLEIMTSICDQFLDLQDLVKHNGYSVVVTNGDFQEDIVAQA